MKSQEQKSAAERSFRPARPSARVAAGIAAAVAVASFAFLVFGPLSDQRAFALAGVHDAGSSGYAESRAPPVVALRVGQAASGAAMRRAGSPSSRGPRMAVEAVASAR